MRERITAMIKRLRAEAAALESGEPRPGLTASAGMSKADAAYLRFWKAAVYQDIADELERETLPN